jgi:ubiquinone/menaquinone biosynthesis C-methylase UbiE
MRAGFDLYFKRIVPWLGRLISAGYAYEYLAGSLVYLPDDDQFRSWHEAAGFEHVEKRRLALGAAQLVTAVRVFPDAVNAESVSANRASDGGERVAG